MKQDIRKVYDQWHGARGAHCAGSLSWRLGCWWCRGPWHDDGTGGADPHLRRHNRLLPDRICVGLPAKGSEARKKLAGELVRQQPTAAYGRWSRSETEETFMRLVILAGMLAVLLAGCVALNPAGGAGKCGR